MSFTLQDPFIYFNHPNNSNPVGLGKLYIGLPDTNPTEPENQVPVFTVQPDGSELAISQPIQLTAGGIPSRNGTPVQLKINAEAVSVRINNKNNGLLYDTARWSPAVDAASFAAQNSSVRIAGFEAKQLRLINGVKNLIPIAGAVMTTNGFYANSSVGGGAFYFDPLASKANHNGGTIIAPEALAAWSGAQTDIATLLNWTGSGSGCFVRQLTNSVISANWFGAGGGIAASIDHLPIQAALDVLDPTFERGGIVTLDSGIDYKINGTITVAPHKTLDCRGALVYAGNIVEAFRVGSSALSPNLAIQAKLLNINLILQSITTIGVHMMQVTESIVTGYIEGIVGSTGRNLGVWIDGGDASAFFNEISVRCNHIYEGFRVKSSGTVHATNQLFTNCHSLGDYVYGNTGSIGINFGADSLLNEGEGSVVLGGNFEQCGIGMYISEHSGAITSVGTRFENSDIAIDILFKGASVRAHAIVNPVAVKNIVYESPASSLATIINSNGIDGTSSIGRKVKGGYQYQDQQTFIGTKYGADGTGYILTQAGLGSLTTGAAHVLYAQNHPTKSGSYEVNVTAGGDFRVGQNLFSGAGYYFKAASTEVTAARDNVAKLGSASERWTEVFAVNGTINTSDARDKTTIRPFTAQELEASKLIAKEFGFFKWIDAVAEKGDAARSHCGTTVQRIIEIMESCGLVAADYGFICYDEWSAQDELREVVQVDVDHDGSPVMQEVVTRPARPAGNRYSLRDGELMKFIAKGFDARLTELEEQ